MSTTCPICKTAKAGDGISYDDCFIYKCPTCGKYKISGSTHAYIENKTNLNKLSSWVSEQNKIYKESMPYINSENIEQILNQRDRKIKEKFDCMMLSLNLCQARKHIKFNNFNHCYIKDENEFRMLLKRAEENQLIEYTAAQMLTPSQPEIIFNGLTYGGQEYIEKLEETNKHSNKIFMAFWFDNEKKMQNIFDGIVKQKIEAAGFLADRVSSSTTRHDNKISDEIIAKIKSSRAVIADCTGNRTAVYYEAGFAMGMKIPVFWTCKSDEKDKICFDVNQHPFILWQDEEELADKIVQRLKAWL